MNFRLWFENSSKQLLDTYGKYKVYVVNGQAIRNTSLKSEEFGGAASFVDLPDVIPKNEIWIEDDVAEKERDVLITSILYQLKLVENGCSKEKAYESGLQKEKACRAKQSYAKQNPLGTNEPAYKSIHVKKYGVIASEHLTVWVVDGEEVRDHYKVDFIEGGNGGAYPWIPNNEIWIENGIHESEIPFIILHEFSEFVLMKYDKMPYEKAHKIASKIEFDMRDKGLSKPQALNLTKEITVDYGQR
jgi:hypothetical protein